VTPRVSPSYEFDRDEQERKQELFWRYVFAPDAFEAKQMFTAEEFRVLSKGASGGSFLSESVEDQVVVAARAESAIARASFELRAEKGDLLGLPLATSCTEALNSGSVALRLSCWTSTDSPAGCLNSS
jgi:hypothetical protein